MSVKLVWNYGDIKDTPEKCIDAIYIEDHEEDTIAIGINDIDMIIEKLTTMKEEWEKRHYITELPERFEFIIGSKGKGRKYTVKTYDKANIIVMWVENDGSLDAELYDKEQALNYINTKAWNLV